jgi:hypothetical protein
VAGAIIRHVAGCLTQRSTQRAAADAAHRLAAYVRRGPSGA